MTKTPTMKIIPDYSKYPMCHFCKKKLADSKCGTSTDFYCVSELGFMSYRNVKITVEVPRCKECDKKHTLACLPGVVIALVIYALMIVKIIIPSWHDNYSIGENLLYTMLMLVIASIPAVASVMLSQLLMSFVVKTESELWIEDYDPIRKLKGMGFRQTQPKAHNHPRATFTEERFRTCLKSIVEKDNCLIDNHH